MLSFWEKQLLLEYDFVVVGAGIMGCSVAFELREKFPKASIVVIERGVFPTGASTKNAGFLCYGSPTEILSDLKNNKPQKVFELVAQRFEGIKILEERFKKQDIGLEKNRGHELIINETIANNIIDGLNEWLLHVFKTPVFTDVSADINNFGFKNCKQLIVIKHEAQIHSGKLMQQYWQLLNRLNIQVFTGIQVENISGNTMYVSNEFTKNFTLQATNIILCTNAFMNEILPKIPIKPGRGQVLITKPIENLKIKGNFHFEEGFYYFRNVGNRILFGGGRNLDFATEETTKFEPNEKILQYLTNTLKEIILPNHKFEIEQTWQGIMGFSNTKEPVIMQLNKHTLYVMACNGMGIALSPFVAKLAMQKY